MLTITPFSICLLLAVVCFFLAAFRVSFQKFDLVTMGYAFVTLAFLSMRL